MTTLLVTGTGTGVGKTVVTAALAACARAAGRSVAVVKPVQTGVRDGEIGDVEEIERLAGVAGRAHVRLPDPLAPQRAARLAGVDLPPLEEHAERIRILREDLVLVEGAGGVLVRLDGATGTLAGLACLLPGSSVLVVVGPQLGTLNQTELTIEALRARRVAVLGLVIGCWPADPGLAERSNWEDLPTVTGVPLLGALPGGVGALSPAAFRASATRWLAPSLGGSWRDPSNVTGLSSVVSGGK